MISFRATIRALRTRVRCSRRPDRAASRRTRPAMLPETPYRRKHGKAWELKSVSGYMHPSFRHAPEPAWMKLRRIEAYRTWQAMRDDVLPITAKEKVIWEFLTRR